MVSFLCGFFFFFKQKTAYEMRISDWSSDVCSSDLVHPFSPPAVIAGQGTVGLEIVEQVPDVDTLLVAIGGGGLIAGVATAIKALRPGVRIVGIEPEGAPTHHASRAAARMVTLHAITQVPGTLAPRPPGATQLELASRHFA